MKIDRSKFLSLCLSMIPVVSIACGGGGDDGTNAGGSDLSAPGGGTAAAPGAATKNPAAGAPAAADVVTVNTNPVSINTEGCKVDIKAPVVSIPTNKAAETAINGVLGKLSASPCSEGGVDIESAFEVTANANGLLSILVTGSEFFDGAAHPNGTVATFNFDVKNGGKELNLSDVLTADGINKELAACIIHDPASEGMDPGAPATEGGIAQDDCKFSLLPQSEGFDIQPSWVARPTGLEIEAGTNHAAGDFFGSVVAWKDLQPSGLTANTVVADFAKNQK